MSYLGCSDRSQLGFLPAVPAVASAVGSVVGLVKGLFGGGGGVEGDAGEGWYRMALAGDIYAEAMLRCMAKVGRPQDEALLRAHPPQPPESGTMPWLPPDCFSHGWAHTATQAKARTFIQALEAQRLAGQVGTALIGQSNIPPTAQALLNNPLLLGAAAVGLYLVLRRR